MGEKILYKYLDAEGGAGMLFNHNLMFTNATQLNDPFECHQRLIDYSKAPSDVIGPWDQKTIEGLEVNRAERLRDKTWICSLSKVYNSLLMWTFYAKNHQGICVGIDMDKAKKHLDRMLGLFVGCPEIEVQYKSIVEKPDGFRDKIDFFTYQLGTKAKEWEYEKEVRLVAVDPSPIHMRLLKKEQKNQCCMVVCEKICKAISAVTNVFKNNTDNIVLQDWREVHAFADLGGECFDSLYLGKDIVDYKRKKIIEFAKNLNPNIKIYQMTIDPEAFRLKGQLIEE